MTDTLAARYGGRPSPATTRARWAVVALVAAVAIAILVEAGLRAGSPAVTFQVNSFTTTTHSVTVEFSVTKAPLAEALCVVRSRDVSGLEIGRASVLVGPRRDGRRTTDVRYTLPTQGVPNTGEVETCRIVRSH